MQKVIEYFSASPYHRLFKQYKLDIWCCIMLEKYSLKVAVFTHKRFLTEKAQNFRWPFLKRDTIFFKKILRSAFFS